MSGCVYITGKGIKEQKQDSCSIIKSKGQLYKLGASEPDLIVINAHGAIYDYMGDHYVEIDSQYTKTISLFKLIQKPTIVLLASCYSGTN